MSGIIPKMPPTTGYSFGDVVLVPFPFTDQTGTKKRPAVIISSAVYNTAQRDLVIMAVTSQFEALRRNWRSPRCQLAGCKPHQTLSHQAGHHHHRAGACHPSPWSARNRRPAVAQDCHRQDRRLTEQRLHAAGVAFCLKRRDQAADARHRQSRGLCDRRLRVTAIPVSLCDDGVRRRSLES